MHKLKHDLSQQPCQQFGVKSVYSWPVTPNLQDTSPEWEQRFTRHPTNPIYFCSPVQWLVTPSIVITILRGLSRHYMKSRGALLPTNYIRPHYATVFCASSNGLSHYQSLITSPTSNFGPSQKMYMCNHVQRLSELVAKNYIAQLLRLMQNDERTLDPWCIQSVGVLNISFQGFYHQEATKFIADVRSWVLQSTFAGRSKDSVDRVNSKLLVREVMPVFGPFAKFFVNKISESDSGCRLLFGMKNVKCGVCFIISPV